MTFFKNNKFCQIEVAFVIFKSTLNARWSVCQLKTSTKFIDVKMIILSVRASCTYIYIQDNDSMKGVTSESEVM